MYFNLNALDTTSNNNTNLIISHVDGYYLLLYEYIEKYGGYAVA
jgi:hypothetical protein